MIDETVRKDKLLKPRDYGRHLKRKNGEPDDRPGE